MKASTLLAAGSLMALVGSASAIDRVIPTRILVVKTSNLVKFVSKEHGHLVPTLGSADDPTISGATLVVKDLGGAGGTLAFDLDASGWTAIGSGYKYKGKDDVSDPNPKGTCRVVLLTESTIKAVCKDDDLGTISLTTPFGGAGSVVLMSGSDRYCAEAGGDEKKNDVSALKRKFSAPPDDCFTPCDGYEYAGGCWYAGVFSCDETCAAQGKFYSDLTRTVAGSEGTDADCHHLIQQLLGDLGTPFAYECEDGFGCFANQLLGSFRCTSPATNSTASGNAAIRMCACE